MRDKLLILVVDDDLSYGSSVSTMEFHACLVWRVDRTAAEVLLTTYVPALVVGNGYRPSETAMQRLARSAAPRPPLILTSVPAWAVDSIVQGFADQAARRRNDMNRASASGEAQTTGDEPASSSRKTATAAPR